MVNLHYRKRKVKEVINNGHVSKKRDEKKQKDG